MVLRLSSIAFMAIAILFLCLATFANAENTRQLHGSRARHHRRDNVITKAPAWAKEITNSPGHQNPAMAPPDPTVELELSDDSATSLDQYYKDAENATESSDVTPNKSHLSRRSLEKRGSGPLYCKDGPCADDSCCGPEKICGYGPDYCGKGCSSNCDATAMCGEYSEEGEMPCGMNLCCSASGWCGTTEVFCDNADPVHKTLPCQAGYGSCNIASSPSCAKGSGSTNGRTIGYYQSWNVRARKCDTKTPKQLNTKGFTHLFYSFAFIDPVSFKVTPAHDDDVKQMREFTDLSKDGKLQTWIAIGGFDFSNENTSTHTTWSDMVSTKANRASFIDSVRAYMDEYGFQGVDLDWEYPGEPKRGGRKLADTRNFSMLLKEMRAAYGSKYGISLTLAPDYWYLRWFDAKAMEPYVDFFGFMAYDLHGYWDEDVKTLGKIIRGQADIREIGNNTIPLWFGGLDPKKLNFGLALYGRGYTVADKSCNNLGCSFVGPSKKGECTDSDGVMSLGEIKNLIKKGVKSTYLKDSMMKQITFDDQWIGYDDEETFADKKAWADGYCFGGTMIWSIDFQPSDNSTDGSGDVPALPDLDGIGAIPKELQDKVLKKCDTGFSYDNYGDLPKLWYDSGAEQWADAYIKSQKDHTNWAQNLYRNLFEKKDHTKFSCVTPNSRCDFDASCAEFNKIGKGGLYYLFQSMSSFHTFMKALNQQFDSKITLTLATVSEMRLILDIKSGLPQTTINIGSVLGSAFSMASAIAAPIPAVGGPLAGISGLASMIGTFTSTVGGNDNAVDATDTLTFAVKTAAVEGKRKIASIVSSVYGDFGHAQTDLPKTMLVGGADNPAIKVFGYGAWLRDNDLTDLSGAVERMSDKMNQALLWQMARLFKGFYVVIRDDLPINKCTHPNNAWDDRTGRCLDILSWWPKSASGRVGGDLAMEKVWDKWNMSPLWTLRNAVECWENNGGKIGDAKVKALQSEWTNGVPPPCFFAMPVLKGNWSKDAASDGAIWLAGDFVGQEGQAGRLWPKDKCDKANRELDPITGGQVKKCSSLNKVGGEK
ncbi:hypothetical protein FOPG_10455 [Fusarium oxysporum f. sp. conglutinans race 2 54008]|uniref:chitinase n=1 Tax=Fusarium oxysporum f. sp. conglutinans race 2 54008 TaxID=1089457 RepID=X0IMY0_FUSOX|nr:hypothetical protein FOPG_10455 [Fusarium oxysporum f. sp. conglutinans race 2 54008]